MAILLDKIHIHNLNLELQNKIFEERIQTCNDSINILTENDFIRVLIDEEGKNIEFKTLDQISIIVPYNHALGVGNKDLPK